ncbi:restriction endonuclease subunit S [Agromyces sp. NPDC055658]
MPEWPYVTLGEVTTKIGSGATPRGGQSVYQANGVSLIRSQNVLDNAMKTEGLARISDGAAESLRSVTVEADDVLINITGDSVARSAIMDPSLLPARVNQHVAILRPTPSLNSLFLQKLLVAPEMKSHLLTIATAGGTRNALTKAQLSRLRIPLPPLAEQRAIAEVLGALDDKIAANTALAETLSKLLATDYLAVARAATETVPLTNLVTTQYGVTTSAVPDAQGTGLLRVTDINKRPWIDWDGVPGCVVDEREREKYLLHAGDIVVARMADPGKTGWVAAGDPPAVFASYLVRLRAVEPFQAPFIYQFLRSSEYIRYAEGAMQGSVQKNMNAKVIVATDIALPEEQQLRDYAVRFEQTWSSMASNLRENRIISATRDALLPQLMSGKLRVRDAEAAASEAGV